MSDLPIACHLTDAELRARRDGLLAKVRSTVSAAELLPEGLAMELPSSDAVVRDLLDLIVAERACCPFLEFHLRTGPGTAPIRLTITGPAGSRGFLETLGLAPLEREGEMDATVR